MRLQRWWSNESEEEIHWFDENADRYVMGMNPKLLNREERKQFLRLVDRIQARLYQEDTHWAFSRTSFVRFFGRHLRRLWTRLRALKNS